MKLNYLVTILLLTLSINGVIKSECENCKKIQAEFKTLVDQMISMSKEMRELIKVNVQNFDTIRKYQA